MSDAVAALQIAAETSRAIERLDRAIERLGDRIDRLEARMDRLSDKMDTQFRWLIALILLSGAGPIIARAFGLIH